MVLHRTSTCILCPITLRPQDIGQHVDELGLRWILDSADRGEVNLGQDIVLLTQSCFHFAIFTHRAIFRWRIKSELLVRHVVASDREGRIDQHFWAFRACIANSKTVVDAVRTAFTKISRVILAVLDQAIAAQEFATCQALWRRLLALEKHDARSWSLLLPPQTDAADVEFPISLKQSKRICLAQHDDMRILAHGELGNIL